MKTNSFILIAGFAVLIFSTGCAQNNLPLPLGPSGALNQSSSGAPTNVTGPANYGSDTGQDPGPVVDNTATFQVSGNFSAQLDGINDGNGGVDFSWANGICSNYQQIFGKIYGENDQNIFITTGCDQYEDVIFRDIFITAHVDQLQNKGDSVTYISGNLAVADCETLSGPFFSYPGGPGAIQGYLPLGICYPASDGSANYQLHVTVTKE